jgi:hypothetical protein
MKAKVRIIDNKIACCSQVCEEGSCPHYAGCPEYEVSLNKPGINPEWKQIGPGMYELQEYKRKRPTEEQKTWSGEWTNEWHQSIKKRAQEREARERLFARKSLIKRLIASWDAKFRKGSF